MHPDTQLDNIRRSVHLGIKSPEDSDAESLGLALSLSHRNLKATAFSIDEKRIQGLWKFDFSQAIDDHDYAELVSKLSGLDEGLDGRGYDAFHFQIFNTKAFLMPESLYRKSNGSKYYGVNFFNYPEDRIYTDDVEANNAVIIYSLPIGLERSIKLAYPGADIHHQNSDLIRSLISQYKDHEGNLGFVHQNGDHVSILFMRDGELHFCNTFLIRSSEELLYFLMGAGEEVHFDVNTVKLVLLGDFETGSESYVLLNKYYRNMSLVPRPVRVRYGDQFSKFRMHPYYGLFSCIE